MSSPPAYAVFDLRLSSNIAFPELPPAARRGRPATFHLARPAPPPKVLRWTHHVPRPDGKRWLSISVGRARVRLRFHGQADFLARLDSVDVEARPVPGTSEEAVRHLYLDHVLPRLLAGAGRTVLHASAVEVDGVAIVFAGESGSGKSTLAASFCAAGARLLSDDAVLLDDRFRVIPSYPVHRLWPSSASVLKSAPDQADSRKCRLGPQKAKWSSAPAPLAAIYLLGSLRQPSKAFASLPSLSISTLPGSAAMLSLVRQSYRLNPEDRARAAAEFRVLGRLVEAVPQRVLTHPRSLPGLPAVRKKIMQNLHRKFQRRDAFGV